MEKGLRRLLEIHQIHIKSIDYQFIYIFKFFITLHFCTMNEVLIEVVIFNYNKISIMLGLIYLNID